ncbi:probable serine/threonine-protein kinase MARK-A [Chelonus insularis]|uniref:probable serine/threonine-protein kinase MARK-A n=1 Tax=Chelonus insularis TaxID=460826 RepID=UPI00158BCDCF|nr:probable serine/threonine-protein kinase MARK-A [Chelonus insularis]
MMMAPQVVGVLLKKPGQQNHPCAPLPSLAPPDTKIRGELYVEDLGERRMVSIRMGWLWVEGTPMRLALRALNLRQASPGICQPHALALGFTLSNSKGDHLATFWADTEPIYWSWVRAIAAELVRQTPFRAQRCLNFLEILMICPRGPLPLPESPLDSRRRSRSELRCWLGDSSSEKDIISPTILDDTRRRARSELRCWSSSNSSDEDIVGEFRSIPQILPKMQPITRAWGCSESSEGSDDSLPWGGNSSLSAITLPEAPTREQRIQRYKEARRRENEARTKRVLEEDARRRKARAEENNNDVSRYSILKLRSRASREQQDDTFKNKSVDCVDSVSLRLPPIKPEPRFQRNLEDTRNNNNLSRNLSNYHQENSNILAKIDLGERRSRTRERRTFKLDTKIDRALQDRLNPSVSKIPICRQTRTASSPQISDHVSTKLKESKENLNTMEKKSSTTGTNVISISLDSPCEEDVAKLLERCQRVDHYVPVREKLTLFESLSRLGGRLARSTEDLGRTSSQPSPKGKQRARSLHDLNRGVKTVPVREMCRLFEGEKNEMNNYNTNNHNNYHNNQHHTREQSRNLDPPCVRASTRRRQYPK